MILIEKKGKRKKRILKRIKKKKHSNEKRKTKLKTSLHTKKNKKNDKKNKNDGSEISYYSSNDDNDVKSDIKNDTSSNSEDEIENDSVTNKESDTDTSTNIERDIDDSDDTKNSDIENEEEIQQNAIKKKKNNKKKKELEEYDNNEIMKIIKKGNEKQFYRNYFQAFRPLIYNLASEYLSDINSFLYLIPKLKSVTKGRMHTNYQSVKKMSSWPIPYSKQQSSQFRLYENISFEKYESNKNEVFEKDKISKEKIDSYSYISDSFKEEIKAYSGEYWKKINHKENYEYEELIKIEEKEMNMNNRNLESNEENQNNKIHIDSQILNNEEFQPLQEEQILRIQKYVLENFDALIENMMNYQKIVNDKKIHIKNKISNETGIYDCGDIIQSASLANISSNVIKRTCKRLKKLYNSRSTKVTENMENIISCNINTNKRQLKLNLNEVKSFKNRITTKEKSIYDSKTVLKLDDFINK